MARRLLYGLAFLLLLVGGLYLALSRRAVRLLAERPPVRTVALPASDTTSLARGEHLSRVLGCEECHGASLEGAVLAEAPPASMHAPNLTRGQGGVGALLTPERVEQAVRQGIGTDGRRLYVMPAFSGLADADVSALAAYLAQVAPVDRAGRGVQFTALGRLLVGAGTFVPEASRAPATTAPAAPPPSADRLATGRYFVGLTCQHCHGAALKGGPSPDPSAPPAPDLGPSGRWDEADFATTLRTGVRPTGPALDPGWMPWKAFAHLTDDEVAAVHAAVQERTGAR